jgi:hypothetical protein
MLEVLPQNLTLPGPMIDDMVLVAKEWLDWRLDDQKLSKRAHTDLSEVIDRVVRLMPATFRNHLVGRNYPYVADLRREQGLGDELEPILARRYFAVPYPAWREDDEVALDNSTNSRPAQLTPVKNLDAANIEHRRIITQAWLKAENADEPDLFASRCAVIDLLATTWRRNLTQELDDSQGHSPVTDLRLDQYVRELIAMAPASGHKIVSGNRVLTAREIDQLRLWPGFISS